MNDHDDAGKPPYPIIKDLSQEERDYVSQWMDHYISKGLCSGYLKEFNEQQKSGTSDWKLPEIPQF